MSRFKIFTTLLLIVLLSGSSLYAQQKNKLYLNYIEQYKDIAVRHQKEHGIPASITLAQGLLESGAGRSTLALKSNNHFGIKCHSGWKGGRTYHDDDAKGECFRAYRDPKDSYEDHARFLKKKRYAPLFELKITDYRGWAKGLKECGYATDKAYASKLIQTIELYELYEYDRPRKNKREKESSKKELPVGYKPHQVYRSWGLLYVEAREGDEMEMIAKELGFNVKKLYKFNEIPKGFPVSAGDIIYLEKKNKKAEKGYDTYTVRCGDSMHSISQKFGMQMKSLYKLNKKDGDYVPSEGDILKLR